MKKVLSIILCAVIAASCMSFSSNAVSIKPPKVNFTSLSRISKSSVKLKWNKSKKSNGYIIYMKTNNGNFKKIKTTKSNSYTKTNLKIGSSYAFKIKAYRNYKSKKYYGKFSTTKKIYMKSYSYLVEEMRPYATTYNWGYTEYKGAEPLEMAGNKYYHGFTLKSNYNETAFAIFNLNGKYSKIEFTLGNLENGDKELFVECDDEITNTINVKEYSLPKKYIVDISNVYKFKLSYYREYFVGTLGFGDVKLYY